MKIHIVQKEESLWLIAQKYGVSLDELIASNTQLSNPEQIMPGMKIKIPNSQTHSNSHSDKSNKGEHKPIPNQKMPPIHEDEQTNCAPLEKEMPSLPMHFHPQQHPYLSPQPLPNVAQNGGWGHTVPQDEMIQHPTEMNENDKGEYHHMNEEQMNTMPYPGQQPPSMGNYQQEPMPFQPPQQMQGYQGMQPSPMGYYPNPHPMGPQNQPYPGNMPEQQMHMQQPMMPSPCSCCGMMPLHGMHPAMSPAMPPNQQPSHMPGYPPPHQQGHYNDCGCGGPREE